MKKHIVCFGDSNTHGLCIDISDSLDHSSRFNEEERWPSLLQSRLGSNYYIAEEGLSGRTTVFEDALHEGMNGLIALPIILNSHEPVDLLILMLGTNDCNERTGVTATNISQGLERLIKKAKQIDCWGCNEKKILVIAPPPIGKGIYSTATAQRMGHNCVEKSQLLPQLFSEVAKAQNCYFLDASECEFNTIDYMHLSKKGHQQLADLVMDKMKHIYNF